MQYYCIMIYTININPYSVYWRCGWGWECRLGPKQVKQFDGKNYLSVKKCWFAIFKQNVDFSLQFSKKGSQFANWVAWFRTLYWYIKKFTLKVIANRSNVTCDFLKVYSFLPPPGHRCYNKNERLGRLPYYFTNVFSFHFPSTATLNCNFFFFLFIIIT